MKNLLVLLSLLFTVTAFSQPIVQENFIVTRNVLDSMFQAWKSKVGADSLEDEGSGYNRYQEWINSLECKVMPHGDIGIAQVKHLTALNTWVQNGGYLSKNSLNQCNWTELGPKNVPDGSDMEFNMGRVQFITFDKNNPNKIFTGAPKGGLWYSTDAGASWNNGGTDDLPIIGVADLELDPNNSNTWFIATGDGEGYNSTEWNSAYGIYRKVNGGAWELIADAVDLGAWNSQANENWNGWQIKKLLVDPNTSSGTVVMYAVTSFGIYKTGNALAANPTWTKLSTGGGQYHNNPYYDIEFKINSSGTCNPCSTIYASGKYEGNQAIIVSNDYGNSWSPISLTGIQNPTQIMRVSIEMSKANTAMFYALVVYPDPDPDNEQVFSVSRLYRYTYATGQWKDKGPIGNTQSWAGDIHGVHVSRAQAFEVSPLDATRIYVGDVNLARCDNGLDDNFCTWVAPAASLPHDDIHAIEYSADANTLWLATDGGVFRSTNPNNAAIATVTHEARSRDLAVCASWKMATSAAVEGVLLVGDFDAGTARLNNGTWTNHIGGDGTQPMISHLNPDTMYGSSQQSDLRRSINRGVSFPNGASVGGGLAPNWDTYAIMNTVNPRHFYQAGEDAHRTFNAGTGGSFNQISDFSITPFFYDNYSVRKIWTSPTNRDVLYATLVDTDDWTLRLLRTENANHQTPGSVSWTLINGQPTTQWIVDLAVDYNDPRIVYVLYGGNAAADASKKLYKYNGNTSTWTNLTSNLPNINFSSIAFEKNSDGAIYLGSKLGTYYTNNVLMGLEPTGYWHDFSTGLPNAEVAELEIHYPTNEIRASLYGRGVWETCLFCSELGSDVIIQGSGGGVYSETWNVSKRMYNDVIIKNNATLTITATIAMLPETRIVIERGGKLIVDGGTLTSSCGGMWKGIVVEGNTGVSQYTAGAQGWLEVKNNALIEHARDAISTKRDNGGVDYSFMGGIVQCTNSTFRNNRRSAEFLPFHNPSDISNRGYFIDCIFEITKQLNDPATVPAAFVSMWDVKGVQFRGNTFECESTSGYTGTNRGKGITTLNALYNINENGSGVGNTFTNLDMAVEQGSSAPFSLGTNYTSGNTFNDNRHGVYISGTGNPPYIDNNTFYRPSPAVASPASYGVYTTGAKGITIGCNSFSYLTYGNMILTTGTTSDPASLIIDNDFIENYRGIQLQNSNTNLQIRYNDFTKSTATQMHWYIAGLTSAQGSCLNATSPAGNKFIGAAPATYKDIYNTHSSYAFTYFHHRNSVPVPLDQVKPEIYLNQYVTNIQCNFDWTAITFCSGGGGGSLMAGSGGSEEFSLSESFNSLYIEEPELSGEEAVVADINNYIYTTGLETSPETTIQYLEGLNSEQADWMLAPYYLGINDYASSATLLSTLEAENNNEATKLNYYHTITNAGLQGRNLSQLNSNEVATLNIIATSNSDVRDNARSVLSFFYGQIYPTEELNVSDIPLLFSEPVLTEPLVIPNVITPNGDGSNDVFVIENLPEHSSLTIYSNSGTQVFHSDNYENNWPPSEIAAGRYYYTLILPDGSVQNSYFDVVY